MPEELEQELKAKAKRKGFTGKRANRYVYGTLRKTGWTPSHQKAGPNLKSSPQQLRNYMRRKR